MFRSTAGGGDTLVISRSVGERFKELLVKWIVNNNLPFAAVEHTHFRELLSLLDPTLVEELLPKAGNTVRMWLEESYRHHRDLLKRDLLATSCLKHLFFDLWTSPNSYALLAIIAHYTTKERTLRVALLGIIRIGGSHSGDNLGVAISQVIENFAIKSSVGYFVTDNAESNDTCVTSLLTSLSPALTASQISQQKQQRRLRCVGHIINLAARAFIEAGQKQLLKSLAQMQQLEAYRSVQEEVELLKMWRQRGPVGKLHNIVHHIRRSPQRREMFVSFAKFKKESQLDVDGFNAVVWREDPASLQMKGDNDTRRNSVYEMISRAIRLRESLDFYCGQVSNTSPDARVPTEDVLTHQDWLTLIELRTILASFSAATRKFEGNSPTFPEVIATLFGLIQKLKEDESRYHDNLGATVFDNPNISSQGVGFEPPSASAPQTTASPSRRPQRQVGVPKRFQGYELDFPHRVAGAPSPPVTPTPSGETADLFNTEVPEYDVRFIRTSIRFAITKLTDYYDLLQQAPVYWYAMILHPGHRMRWIERNLNEERASHIITSFKQFLQEEYNDLEGPSAGNRSDNLAD